MSTTEAGGKAVSGPKRVQLRRTKGWHKPAGTISVARPSRWGNPFRVGGLYQVPGPSGRGAATARSPWRPPGAHVGVVADRADAVRLYRLWLTAGDYVADEAREQLAGHDLACWCLLLEFANPEAKP